MRIVLLLTLALLSAASSSSLVAQSLLSPGDCIQFIKIPQTAARDTGTLVAIVDTCRHRADTIFVSGVRLSGDIVLQVVGGLTATARPGAEQWLPDSVVRPADTVRSFGRLFITPRRVTYFYRKIFTADTLELKHIVHWNDIVGKPIESTFFFHEEASGIPGYEALLPMPADDPEHIDTVAVSAGTSPVLLRTFSTLPLAASYVSAGKWIFHPYVGVDNGLGETTLYIVIKHRDTSGTETDLFTMTTSDIDHSAIEVHDVDSYQQGLVFHDSDRIVVSVYAQTTSVPSRNVYFAYEGDSLYSHFHLPDAYSGVQTTSSAHGDSIRVLYDRLAGMPGFTYTGLVDRLAVWADDSTLVFSISIDSLFYVLNKAMGKRDSTWYGEFNVPTADWALPTYIEEGPFPDWYTKDWGRYEKFGMYINEQAYPFELVWHLNGDTAAVWELKLPRARLLEYLGIDTTTSDALGPKLIGLIYPDSGSNWSTFQNLVINDSTRNFRMAAGPGITFQPIFSSNTKDTLTFFVSVDYDVLWYRIRDSVLANAGEGGGGGATTFLDLTDTPMSYATKGGQLVRVNPAQNGLEFVPVDTLGTVTINNYPAVQSVAVNYDAAMYNYNNYTTNDSWTNLNLDGDPSRKFTNVRISSTTHVWGRVSGLSRNGYEVGAYDVWGQVTNIGGVIALKSSSVTPLLEDDASWDFRFNVEDTTKIINFQVKGTNTDTVFWAAQIFVNEVYYYDPQSNWTPANLAGSDSLLAWYDAVQHTTFIAEGSGDTTWIIPDFSGRGNHAIRTTTPKYTYVDSAYFGAVATSFGGYAVSTPASVGVHLPTLGHAFFVAERTTAGATGIALFNLVINGIPTTVGLGESYIRNTNAAQSIVSTVGTAGRPSITESIVFADSIGVYVNEFPGSQRLIRGTQSPASYFLFNASATATTAGFRGYFKELVIVRGKNMTEPDRVRMWTYLRLKHKI